MILRSRQRMSHSPSRASLTTLVMLATTILVLSCGRKDSSGPTPVLSVPPNTAYPMPPVKTDAPSADLGWTSLAGQRSRIADFRGKVLVLDFYATWCVPCRQSIPHLLELQSRSGSKGLQIVGLNVGGPDDRVKVADFAKEFPITYPLGFPDKAVTDFFLSDDDRLPQTFVFDRQGQLVKRLIGYDTTSAGQLEQAIESALISSPN